MDMGRGHRPPNAARRLGIDSNPLRRAIDRVETATLLFAIMVGLLAVPVAAAYGTATYDATSREARWARSVYDRHMGRTLEPAGWTPHQEVMSGMTVPVRIAWVDSDGRRRRSVMDVASGTPRGARVAVWTDQAGHQISAPPSPRDILVAGVTSALTGLLLAWLALAVLVGALRCAIQNRRMTTWAREWREVEPVWRRHDWGG